ncbi:MAG: FtsX-like permease family protein [Acidimicrobiales bacterium]
MTTTSRCSPSCRHVRAMVQRESVIIALLGAVLGVAVGLFFGWAMQRSLSGSGVTDLVIPYGQLALYVVAAALAGFFAGALPARRVARIDVLAALAAPDE